MFLTLNGSLTVTFKNLDGSDVDEATEALITENLQNEVWTIGLFSRTVVAYEDLRTTLYTFEYYVNDDMDYHFESEEDW